MTDQPVTTDAAATTNGTAPRARYLQLAATLRAEIRSGQLKPGDPLPTEHELAARYKVSRFTVREALRQLSNDGLIRRKRGSGTVVAADRPVLRQGFADTGALLQYAASSDFIIERLGLVRLAPSVARMLKRPEGESWHLIRGVRVLDGLPEPLALTDAWIHPRFDAHVPSLRSDHEALFSQLSRLAGLRVEKVEQEIQAVVVTAAEAAILRVAPRSPALRILRHYFDSDGALAEMSCSVHPGERFSYTMVIGG